MAPRGWSARARVVAAVVAALVVLGIIGQRFAGTVAPTVDTAEVKVGEYSDVVEIRGQIQPVRSTYVTAPYNAGQLQIVTIVKNGSDVKAGDVVAEFDAVTLRRTIREKQSELRSVNAELQQANAQSRITVDERQAAVSRADFDVQKARLSLGEIGLVSESEAERARLALADAEMRLSDARAAAESAQATASIDRATRERRIERVQTELQRAEAQVEALDVTAPTAGTVNILPNYQSATPGNVPQEYRAGDRAFPGAIILELPDLSSVYLTARIDEVDRGQLRVDQSASVRLDAIPDRDYQAKVSQISLLARTDFTAGWPPPKQFDLTLAIQDPDGRLRPGMSAAARITVGRLPGVLLVPSASIFSEAGRMVVYRSGRRGLEAVPVEILRRGREQAAVKGSLAAGDRVATADPNAPPEGGQP